MAKKAPTKEQIAHYIQELKARDVKPFQIEQYCFSKQLKFIKDSARYKTAVCSRRAGKSESCAAHLIDMAINTAKSTSLYITLTRGNAKRLVWKTINEIIKLYKIDAKPNISELMIEFKNGSRIYFSGANTRDEIEKFRGFSFNLVYLDEAQAFRPYIKELIDEVLAYAVMDTAGSICMIGTPGPIPAGYFFEAAHSNGWSNHAWTIFDNPFIKIKSGKSPDELLAEERFRRGISPNDPSYLREALAIWTQDLDILVYKYNASLNHYEEIEDKDLVYVFGIDLGYNDADAIAVLGYSKKQKKVYLVEEFIKSKQTISDLVTEIQRLEFKYKPVKMVVDAGALGKKITEELKRRHGIPVEAADKNRKIEHIELLNDDLRTGKLMIQRGSTCASDFQLIQWDIVEKNRRTVSDSFHSDIADAVLYAWRACNHFHSSDPKAQKLSAEDKVDQFWDKESKAVERKTKKEWFDTVVDLNKKQWWET